MIYTWNDIVNSGSASLILPSSITTTTNYAFIVVYPYDYLSIIESLDITTGWFTIGLQQPNGKSFEDFIFLIIKELLYLLLEENTLKQVIKYL